MIDLGPHGDYIIASYAITAVAIVGLIIWAKVSEAAQRKVLKRLEEQGITRRSARKE